MTNARPPVPGRSRDPDRKARILAAAADLAARRGFHSVGMAEIGAEAGIVGSGIYRHFASKNAILVALLDQVMARLRTAASAIVADETDDRVALSALIRDHIEVAVRDRSVLAVYHREVQNLPLEDNRRLRREQRLYLQDWVRVLASLRPDLAERERQLAVHAAVGAIQSTLFFRSGLALRRLTGLLDEMAHGCLGVVPAGAVADQATGTGAAPDSERSAETAPVGPPHPSPAAGPAEIPAAESRTKPW
ncbi:MAG TPA: TetR/AcrR family transcriptional regulator [Pseudonocardia sp.]